MSSLMRQLNCMNNYDSIVSIDDKSNDNKNGGDKKVTKKTSIRRSTLMKNFQRIRKQFRNKSDGENESYSVTYESCPEEETSNERTRLISIGRDGNVKNHGAIRRHPLTAERPKPRVTTTIEDLFAVKQKKKKGGILRWTGRWIVRSCQYSTLMNPYSINSAPHVYAGDSDLPIYLGYRCYDFEKGEYDYSSYMQGAVWSPSMYF